MRMDLAGIWKMSRKELIFFFRQKTLSKLPETHFLSFSDKSEPFESAPENFFKKPPKSTP